jgi:uridine kinase
MRGRVLNPLFLLGLVIRLSLIAVIVPTAVADWYAPFLQVSASSVSLDPWAVWLQQGGVPAAFPYGYAMWLSFLPLTLICDAIGIPITYAYGATLFVADIAVLLILRRMLPGQDRMLLAVYWLSPIVIVASYFFGFNDLIPVLFLVVSLYYMRQARLLLAGLACVAAISAKLSMILALPFFMIYLFHNRTLRQFLRYFIKGLLIGAVFTLLPFFIIADAGVAMLLNNPEMVKVYQLTIDLGGNIKIYITPLVYLLILYLAWRVRRLNFELFNAILGISFLLVVLMTPASPGWFVWIVPLLVTYQVNSDNIAVLLVSIFSVLYVLSSLLMSAQIGLLLASFYAWIGWTIPPQLEAHVLSLLHTGMVATGIVLAIRIWRETVSRNDFFRLSRKPFVLGVAGDSGAGKDTFSDAIEGLFGSHSVATVSGDDYHLWDRQKPMWQVMTHLNPMANDLEGLAHDLVSLTDGKSIQSRHYDHQSGRMSRPLHVKSNDIIIASGLHALYLPILRNCYNLSVYLDIDEGLRQYFKLRRDVHQRGHTVERVMSSFEKREPDSVRFIRPQASLADLVFSLQPIHPCTLDDTAGNNPMRFKLVARSRNGLGELTLMRVLIGVCGLHVDMVGGSVSSEVELTIEGETSAEDIALAAHMICPRIFEFLDVQPKWQDGAMGLMQLITLSHINQALTKRFI